MAGTVRTTLFIFASCERLSGCCLTELGSSYLLLKSTKLVYTKPMVTLFILPIELFFNRFNNLLLYLGMSESAAREITISDFCQIIAEFALEYRTTRERVQEAEKKKANHRKRNKTRGKMITEVSLLG